MIEIFYKENGQMMVSQAETDFASISYGSVIWIDLFSPTGEEKRAVEAFLGTTIQSRAQAEEIEISSRFYESEKAIFANTNFLIPGPDAYNEETVSFILKDKILTTLRECPLKSFTDLQRRLLAFPNMYDSGHIAFLSILEQRIDLDADMVELVSKEITQYKLNVLLKDISSLINHTNFSFERLEYLQNTVLGIINLDQNKIMKHFTLVSLLLMPPTLIASFFGMNIHFGWFISNSPWMWVLILALMVLSLAVIFGIFKKRRMF